MSNNLKTIPTNPSSNIEFQSNSEKFSKEMDKSTELLQKAIRAGAAGSALLRTPSRLMEKGGKKKNNNSLLDGDLFNTILDFFNQFNTGLNELTLSQIGALSHLLASIFILLCLFSIIVIIYSDF